MQFNKFVNYSSKKSKLRRKKLLHVVTARQNGKPLKINKMATRTLPLPGRHTMLDRIIESNNVPIIIKKKA
jgi:hypothetical protein